MYNPGSFLDCCKISKKETSRVRTLYRPRVSSLRSAPSAVDAFPWGSSSMTRTRSPPEASAAARLTALVVLPTPPFWFATAMIRVLVGTLNLASPIDSRRFISSARLRARGAPSPTRRSHWFGFGPALDPLVLAFFMGSLTWISPLIDPILRNTSWQNRWNRPLKFVSFANAHIDSFNRSLFKDQWHA